MDIQQVPVRMQTLLRRINRHLAKQGEVLKVARSSGARDMLGAYFIVRQADQSLVRCLADPVALGRELGLLQPWERGEQR